MFSSKFTAMGVMNITPNSFSDGNINLDEKTIIDSYQYLSSWCDIIDIGAESTAPYNEPVDSLVEMERYLMFISIIDKLNPCPYLSFDTYRPEVFYELYLIVKNLWPKTKIIFNDVSGKIDDDLKYLLKICPDIIYILSHNLAPSRDLTSFHMDYSFDGNHLLKHLYEYFNEALSYISHRNVWLDVCFGFSKNKQDNLYLLKNYHHFYQKFSRFYHVLGLSRKSFFRNQSIQNLSQNETSYYLDLFLGAYIFSHNLNQSRIIHRLHSKNTLNMFSHLMSLN